MTCWGQQMVVTTIAALLIVTVTTGAAGDGLHQTQAAHHHQPKPGLHLGGNHQQFDEPQAAHHHQPKPGLHLGGNPQQFDKPQAGSPAREFVHSERLVVNLKSSIEKTYDQANADIEGASPPDKRDGNSTAKHEDQVMGKPIKKEPSLDSVKFSPDYHQRSGEAQYVPRRGEVAFPVHRRPKPTRTIPYNLDNLVNRVNVTNATNVRRKAQALPALTQHGHQHRSSAPQGTNRAYTSDLEGAPCSSDADCYLQNFNDTFNYMSTVVHEPFCQVLDNSSSAGYCTCGPYCVSRSKDSADDHLFYYCGPCGRMGSSCPSPGGCNHTLSSCSDGYCSCDSGEFYDLYYCMIPYYGYEQALQVAIATCIFVAVALLTATIYSSCYRRQHGRVHPYLLRLLMRRANQGTRESPPGDTPPKYDDVVEQPPSYQQALELERSTDGEEGKDNPAFDGATLDALNARDAVDTIGRESVVPEEGIIVKVVATKSSSTDITSNSSGDPSNGDGDPSTNTSASDEAEDGVTDEYARHVARHTGAIPKQRSLAKVKQQNTKRASKQPQQTAPAAAEEGCFSGQGVRSGLGGDMSVSGDGRGSCSVDKGDIGADSDVRDTCKVDSRGKEAPAAQQPITLPLRQPNPSPSSTQF